MSHTLLLVFGLIWYNVYASEHNGFLECPPDPEACTTTNCGNIAGDIRAQYICNIWPFYAGGFSAWDPEDEYYFCVDWSVSYDDINNITVSNGFCIEWITTEKSDEETEFGTCICLSNNDRYCTVWICSQTEFGFGTTHEAYECGTNANGLPKYCYKDESGDEIEAEQDTELTNCWCQNETLYNYCHAWYCEETSHDENGDLVVELENSVCIDAGDQPDQSAVINGDNNERYINDFCWKWKVDVEAEDEFEIADCECNEPHIEFDNSFCESWTCFETGLHKRHNLKWYNFPLAFILWTFFGGFVLCGWNAHGKYIYWDSYDSNYCTVGCSFLFWFIIMGFANIAHGGFVLFVLWIPVSLIGLCVGIGSRR